MKNIVKCPHCGKEFEATEALKHQIEEQVSSTLLAKHKLELEETKKQAEKDAALKVGKDLEAERERTKKLSEEYNSSLDEVRKLRIKDEEREIEMKKKLMEEEEKIKKEARQKSEDEHKLKDLEKDNKLQQALEQIESLKTKIQQGSQQSQGETLELELETKLRAEFPTDLITEVKKGQRGADISQSVVDKLGRNCGVILWESKNAQWSDGWIAKLKEDQRQAKADIAVLVTVNLPDGVESFMFKEGVWICGIKYFIGLAFAVRYNLVSLHNERISSEGKDEKMAILYQYLTGTEFRNRVGGIVDAFTNLQEELEKEKRYFNVKWAKQEKEIRKVIDHTHGMYGDLQAVIGKSLPEMETLQLESESTD